MNLHTIELNGELAADFRAIVSQAIAGVVGSSVKVHLPQSLNVYVDRYPDRIAVHWTPKLEADIPGPVDPDLIRATFYKEHAEVSLRLGHIKVDYGP